jgi:S-(hydroxymethyl)glutathione dehydrogenase/alcohol dehydrogenase
VAPGDHVSLSFIPSCGRCTWCASGRSYVCDEGAKLFDTGMITDGRMAHRCKGQDVARFSQLGAFSEVQLLSEHSLIKVDPELPWQAVALVACGVTTGYGSAIHRAGTRPGDTVAVLGVGGVGMSAVQAARLAGASTVIAIDPLESRRDAAKLFGATHTYASAEEATMPIFEMTRGIMCERVICTPGVMHGALVEQAMTLTAKDGTCVVTGVAPMVENEVTLNLFLFAMMNKELKGCLFGSGNPRADIPHILSLYKQGLFKLDELVTRTYTLEQVNEGYADMLAGRILRGVITF